VSRSAANSFAVLSSLDSAGPESAADVKTPERAAVFGPAFLREAVVGAFRLLPHKGHRSSLFFFLIFLLLLISGYSPAGWIGSTPMTRRWPNHNRRHRFVTPAENARHVYIRSVSWRSSARLQAAMHYRRCSMPSRVSPTPTSKPFLWQRPLLRPAALYRFEVI
jgi:hypothetical protein